MEIFEEEFSVAISEISEEEFSVEIFEEEFSVAIFEEEAVNVVAEIVEGEEEEEMEGESLKVVI